MALPFKGPVVHQCNNKSVNMNQTFTIVIFSSLKSACTCEVKLQPVPQTWSAVKLNSYSCSGTRVIKTGM